MPRITWPAWAIGVLGVIFLVAAAVNAVRGDLPNAAFGAALGLVGIGPFVRAWRDARADERLVGWVLDHAAALQEEGAVLDGRWVTADTPLRRTELVVSLFVLAVRLQSRLFVGDDPRRRRQAWLDGVATFLLGWWSLPGLIFTPLALVRGVRGGVAVGVVFDLVPPRLVQEDAA